MKKKIAKWMIKGFAFEMGVWLGEQLRQHCATKKKRRFWS